MVEYDAIFEKIIFYKVSSIERGVTIKISHEPTNIVRACYIVNAKDDNIGRKSTFFDYQINREWNEGFCRDFNNSLVK